METKRTLSNYEIMRNQMRGEFVKYDQDKMIKKFGLDFDEAYLYITFAGRKYRVGRQTGVVEWSADGFQSAEEADFNESMTIYDVLCYSKEGCCLSGEFRPVYTVKGAPAALRPGNDMFRGTADRFQGHIEQLEYACGVLGEPAALAGDAAAVLQAFPFLPVTVQFWKGDEEFPPNLKIMYDENILDYMHFETVFYMAGHILKRLEEIADEYESKGQGQ